MGKIVSADYAADQIKDGMTILVGGFMSNGTSEILMDALVRKGVKDLTIIANDAGTPGTGIGKLLNAGAVKKLLVSHIGLNPTAGQQMNDGIIQVELVPQGTLAEQIRAGGAGLGGVLTPTGLGTDVAKGKEVIIVEGKEYLLEKPLRADVAIIRGSVIDHMGNIFYKGTTRNFNPLMAMAAEMVIAGAEELVETGQIVGENIVTPGIFVDYIVAGDKA